jgi:hypothetical protein
MTKDISNENYGPKEAAQRREAALKKILATAPKPFTPKKKLSPGKHKAEKVKQ